MLTLDSVVYYLLYLAVPFDTQIDEEDQATETIEGASVSGSLRNGDEEQKGVDWSQIKL